MRRALDNSRANNFNAWYQEVIRRADLAEPSAVRGCMVIKPAGYGIWELIQQALDRRFKATGHENCYFPLFIPMSFLAKEAEHVEGFAKEMAVVTHHRLKIVGGKLAIDPSSKLENPLIVRPTSEMIIADSFRRWIKTHRDLPVLVNQWANVVRWEMRTRLFLRTAEFLWQEGHTAHATREEAMEETKRMLEVYREFAEDVMAMPVIVGEKTANERFPGADNSFSIEAMMQDGKALQAGTSHYLGTHFSKAQDIQFQSQAGKQEFAHTTSWGVSTRLIGGLIMTHGDDDGLVLPPALAPKQVVIVPRLRGDDKDGAVIAYANKVAAEIRTAIVFREQVRVHIDFKSTYAGIAKWDWVRRGIPILIEIGPREVGNGTVSTIQRDKLYQADKVFTETLPADRCAEYLVGALTEMQGRLFTEAVRRRNSMIVGDVNTYAELVDYFGAAESDPEDEQDEAAQPEPSLIKTRVRGWVRTAWAAPTGAELKGIEDQLKGSKLSIRSAPLDQPGVYGRCIFTGRPGTQEILIGRAY